MNTQIQNEKTVAAIASILLGGFVGRTVKAATNSTAKGLVAAGATTAVTYKIADNAINNHHLAESLGYDSVEEMIKDRSFC